MYPPYPPPPSFSQVGRRAAEEEKERQRLHNLWLVEQVAPAVTHCPLNDLRIFTFSTQPIAY